MRSNASNLTFVGLNLQVCIQGSHVIVGINISPWLNIYKSLEIIYSTVTRKFSFGSICILPVHIPNIAHFCISSRFWRTI